jgi:hypothetical protein
VSRGRASLRRVAIRTAEVLLVLAIVGLLIAIWLPAWIGGRPGLSHMQ